MKIFNWVHRKFRQNNKNKDSEHGGHDKVAEKQEQEQEQEQEQLELGDYERANGAKKKSRRMSKEKDHITDHDHKLQIVQHRYNTLTLSAATAFQQVQVQVQVQDEAGEYWLSVGAGESVLMDDDEEQVTKLISRGGLLAIGTFGLERVDEVEEDLDLDLDLDLVQVERSVLLDSHVPAGGDVELQKLIGPQPQPQLDPSNCMLAGQSLLHGNGNENSGSSSSSVINDLYPLQQFFFHSAKTTIPAAAISSCNHKIRKDHSAPRTSLRDLFSSTTTTTTKKLQEDQQAAGAIKPREYNVNAEGAKKKSGWRLSSFVKKIMKSGKTEDRGQVESRCKLEKVMRGLFHRKIYPEHTDTDTDTALRRPKKKCSGFRISNCIIPPKLNDHSIIHRHTTTKCDRDRDRDRDPELVCRGGLCTGHEHWINTDADYVVLEF